MQVRNCLKHVRFAILGTRKDGSIRHNVDTFLTSSSKLSFVQVTADLFTGLVKEYFVTDFEKYG